VLRLLCANFFCTSFEPSEDLDAILVGVLVGDTGTEGVHVVYRPDARVDEPDVSRLKSLFW